MVNTLIDNSETKKVCILSEVTTRKNELVCDCSLLQIKLENDGQDDAAYGGYDQANALVLPSKKRDTKIEKTQKTNVTRILSKKQRKNLEKIVDKKKKKEEVCF